MFAAIGRIRVTELTPEELAAKVVDYGNTTGRRVDKFKTSV
jgi:hypothetical protein